VTRGHVPIRTCLVCSGRKPKRALVRLVIDVPDRIITPDRGQCGDGRGAYVCPDCLPLLRFNRRVEKAFRNKAKGFCEELSRLKSPK
jgi:predicted RNA-binding protein YlxR (DUF448 family)